MSLTDTEKILVYKEIENVSNWIKVYVDNNMITSAARMINRKLELKRLMKDKITITKFISTISSTKTQEYYIKLFNK